MIYVASYFKQKIRKIDYYFAAAAAAAASIMATSTTSSSSTTTNKHINLLDFFL